MLPKRGDELRMSLLDLLEREPALFLHQVNESEVAGTQDHDVAVGHVVLGALGRLPPCRLADRKTDHRALLVTTGELRHVASRHRPLHQVVQSVTVALLERCALRLSMVGEDYELVWPRRVFACPLDSAKLLVELA